MAKKANKITTVMKSYGWGYASTEPLLDEDKVLKKARHEANSGGEPILVWQVVGIVLPENTISGDLAKFPILQILGGK